MDGSELNRPLRVAIACPGVGLSQRGFERMFQDLFTLMRNELDITLFKGAGATGEHEKVPAFLPRNGRFVKLFPVHALLGRSPIHVECLTFALALVPHLREGRFDVVHCIDPPLVRMLYKLRRLLGMRFRLLYTHGVTMPPSGYPPADHLHHVAQGQYDEALDAGIPAGAMTLVPVGIHRERFDSPRSKEELRREYGVAGDTFVILSVAALNRAHKRSHHLIDEAARLEGNYLLWLDASMDQGEPDLVGYAKARLGERCRITHVPSGKVGELYKMADVMAHASTFESFGLSMVEAAAAGLAVLCHDAPHFRWLLPNPGAWIDMTVPGALAARLSQLMSHPELLRDIQCRDAVWPRFSWKQLRPDYRALYEHVSTLAPTGQGGAGKNYFWQVHG
jgi:1,2-diacylglycerol 3-alpha-glucosyltransferase